MIGRIERVPLRDVWKHEASDFTKWLEENIDILADELDIELSSAERETSAGDFSVDIMAEDSSGNPVIIENQLERSDHDHLGKVITYLTMMEAKTAIWIVKDPRPEHVKAITWLNESSSGSFYMLKIEAVRIGESEPAPLLTKIVGPSEEVRSTGDTKKRLGEQQKVRRRFWEGLLNKAKERSDLFSRCTPSTKNWISAGSGTSRAWYRYVVSQHDARIAFYIRGGDADETDQIYGYLLDSRNLIEEAFGDPLEWNPRNGKKSCNISKTISVGGYRDDQERWPKIHDTVIAAMMKLEKAFSPHIEKL